MEQNFNITAAQVEVINNAVLTAVESHVWDDPYNDMESEELEVELSSTLTAYVTFDIMATISWGDGETCDSSSWDADDREAVNVEVVLYNEETDEEIVYSDKEFAELCA